MPRNLCQFDRLHFRVVGGSLFVCNVCCRKVFLELSSNTRSPFDM